ncbi:MAG: glycosyltransferase family 9 protein [Syntrophothermus sp.]
MKKVEIFVKNLLLKLLLLLLKRKNSKDKVVFDQNSRVLFIRLNRIGDALVSTPLLKLIKEKTGCHISVIADKNNSFVFKNNSSVDEIILFNKGFSGILALLKEIKRGRYDAFVDLHDDVSTTVTYIFALSSVKNKFGLKKSNSEVYTQTVDRLDASKTHVVDRLLQLVRLFGLDPGSADTNIVFCPSQPAVAKINKMLETRNLKNGRPLVGINISAGNVSRFWGVENFRNITNLMQQYNADYIIICTTKDINQALEISKNDKSRLFYSPSFDEFAAVVSKLDLLFTPDTSIIHLASAYCVPVFGLYVKFNTSDMIWSPYKSDFDCIVTENYNLSNITAEMAVEKFKPFLEKHL